MRLPMKLPLTISFLVFLSACGHASESNIPEKILPQQIISALATKDHNQFVQYLSTNRKPLICRIIASESTRSRGKNHCDFHDKNDFDTTNGIIVSLKSEDQTPIDILWMFPETIDIYKKGLSIDKTISLSIDLDYENPWELSQELLGKLTTTHSEKISSPLIIKTESKIILLEGFIFNEVLIGSLLIMEQEKSGSYAITSIMTFI